MSSECRLASLALALLVGAPVLAHAQEAPDEEAPPPSDTPFGESPAEAPIVTDAPPPAPAPADPPPAPDDAAPPEQPATDTPPAAKAEPKSEPSSRFVVGIELGVGGIVSGGGVYHAGLGRGLVLGFRRNRITIEWHLLQSYQARIDDELVAANTAHSLGISTYAIRFQAAPMLSLFGGVMRTEIPVVRGTYDDIPERWTIELGTSRGMGPIVGVGVSKKFADDYVTLSAEARIGKIMVNEADPQYLTPTGPPDSNGAIPVTMSTAELNPTVGMLLVGVRISTP